jgi:hypothetical protein
MDQGQAALEQWALVESNIKAGQLEVLKDGEAYDSSPLPEARQIDLLLIHPPGKNSQRSESQQVCSKRSRFFSSPTSLSSQPFEPPFRILLLDGLLTVFCC